MSDSVTGWLLFMLPTARMLLLELSIQTKQSLNIPMLDTCMHVHVTHRSLGQNLLKELPEEISNLVSLKKLMLPSNMLKAAPVQLAGLIGLEWL